jgi:hypothetical protein
MAYPTKALWILVEGSWTEGPSTIGRETTTACRDVLWTGHKRRFGYLTKALWIFVDGRSIDYRPQNYDRMS